MAQADQEGDRLTGRSTDCIRERHGVRKEQVVQMELVLGGSSVREMVSAPAFCSIAFRAGTDPLRKDSTRKVGADHLSAIRRPPPIGGGP